MAAKKAKVDWSKSSNQYSPNKHFTNNLKNSPHSDDDYIEQAVSNGVLSPDILLETEEEAPVKKEKKISKADMSVEEYNASLVSEAVEELKGATILGGRVMIRLLKGDNRTKSNLVIARSDMYVNPETGKTRVDVMDNDKGIKAYLNRAYVVGIGKDCSPFFQNNVKIGTMVELPVSTYKSIYQYVAPRDFLSLNLVNDTNYFLIPETLISMIYE